MEAVEDDDGETVQLRLRQEDRGAGPLALAGVGGLMVVGGGRQRDEDRGRPAGRELGERAGAGARDGEVGGGIGRGCLLYTSPSPRDGLLSRMPSSA